jgi:hypothetical protein
MVIPKCLNFATFSKLYSDYKQKEVDHVGAFCNIHSMLNRETKYYIMDADVQNYSNM